MLEGDSFQTRLTRRVGVVKAHTLERGTLVCWMDKRSPDKYVHDSLQVDSATRAPELVN